MEKRNLPNVTEGHISGISIAALLSNVVMRKYDASDKANIQSINNNIQVIDLNIKGMDIDHFHKNVNYLTTLMAVHSSIILDVLHPLFKAYNSSRIVSSGINPHKLSSK